MTAVADTTPLNYLIQLGLESLFPSLFDEVLVPEAVALELSAVGAPPTVRAFIRQPPSWLKICQVEPRQLAMIPARLDLGESAVIAAVLSLEGATAILDERAARRFAEGLGLRVTGTLGILVRAGQNGWIDVEVKIRELENAGFYLSDDVRRRAIEDARPAASST